MISLMQPCCCKSQYITEWCSHDDIIKWKHFPCYWPFVQGIHRSTVNSPHKGQWRRALIFSLICTLNKQSWGWWFETLSHPHYDIIVMTQASLIYTAMLSNMLAWNVHLQSIELCFLIVESHRCCSVIFKFGFNLNKFIRRSFCFKGNVLL